MTNTMLFLSADRKYLMDKDGNNICAAVGAEGDVYYKAIMPESESIEKVCMARKVIDVCMQWNDAHQCLALCQVEVCTQWQLLQSGYGNVS